jgi:hypothetical protein
VSSQLDVDVEVKVDGVDNLDRAADGVDHLEQKASGFGSVATGVFQGVGQAVAGFGIGIAKAGIDAAIDNIGRSIDLASDKAEAASKAQVLFGDSYQLIADRAKTAATDVGVSSGEYLTLAGNIGNLVTNFGFAGDEAANMSGDIVQLAADVGSFNNAPTADVVEAIGAAFRGESEPIRKFGVMLDDATIKAKAMELGLYDGIGAIDKNAKATASYQLILEQTSKAQGDFARTSDGYANSQKIAGAKIDEALTRVGEVLLPIAGELLPLLADGVTAVVDLFMQLVGVAEDVAHQLEFLKPILDAVATGAGLLGDALDWVTSTAGGSVQGLNELKPKFVDVAAAAGLSAEQIEAKWLIAVEGIKDGSIRTDQALLDVIHGFDDTALAADDLRESTVQSGLEMATASEATAASVAAAWLATSTDAIANMDMGLRGGADIIAARGLQWEHAQAAVSDAMLLEAQRVGEAIPEDIGAGMVAESTKIVDAADRLIELLENGLSPAEQASRLMGEKYTKAVAAGMVSQIPGAKEAAQQTAIAAISTIENAADGTPSTKGLDAIGKYYDALLAGGMTDRAIAVALAAGGVASDVVTKLTGYQPIFDTQGQTWDAKLASGIRGNADAVDSAVVTATEPMRNVGPVDSWGRAVGNAWLTDLISSIRHGRADVGAAARWATAGLAGASPPKVGPLRDIDKWGENVGDAWISPLVDRIAAGRGAIGGALGKVLPQLRDTPAPPSAGGRAGSSSWAPTQIIVNVGIGDPVAIGRQVSEALRAYQRASGAEA